MKEDPHDEEYLDIFKPKTDVSERSVPEISEADSGDLRHAGSEGFGSPGRGATPVSEGEPWDVPTLQAEPVRQRLEQSGDQDELVAGYVEGSGGAMRFGLLNAASGGSGRNLRTIGMFVGGGCLLVLLTAVVVFAFVQVFVRRGGDEDGQDIPTPTLLVAITPSPPVIVAESPLFVPVVSSADVRVPVALPERLMMGERVFSVQAMDAPPGIWPAVSGSGETASWVYGTVVNYVLGLAPNVENTELLSALQVGDILSLQMSTGLILNFNVEETITGTADESAFFEQISPRLTLALLTDDPAQRTVVTAAFFSDAVGDVELFSGASIGLVGTPVDQGPVRVTVIESYQAVAGEAGLPPGTGYLLMDVKVENVGTTLLEPKYFQTFVYDTSGERYPLTLLAEQFAHYGIPTEPLAPGETVIGSLGYLVPAGLEGQVRWAFNPMPGSDHWVLVPVSYALPTATPTSEPPPVGFALVTVNTDDVFVNRSDGLLDIGLRIENISDGVVQVTEDDISLSSWTDGELPLVAPAPLLPWTVEPGELELFQLQFELPTTDSALLSVLGYTFSIENLGGE